MVQKATYRIFFYHASAVFLLLLANAGSVFAQSVPSPTISSISRNASDNTVLVVGMSQPSFVIIVDVISDKAGQIFQAEASANQQGHWELSIPDTSFATGEYTIRALARSPDGLTSAPRDIRGSKLAPQPILTAGGFGVGWLDIVIMLIFAMVVAGAIFAWLHERALRKSETRRLISDRDMHGMCTKLCDEIQELPNIVKSAPGIDSRAALDIAARIFTLQKTLEKMQGYLSSEMRKL